MGPGADDERPSHVPRWLAPQDGYKSQFKRDRRERRRRPLPLREIAFLRVLLALEASFCIVVLAAGPPAPSLWHDVAVSLLGVVTVSLVVYPRHWLLQLSGLRPPADRDR